MAVLHQPDWPGVPLEDEQGAGQDSTGLSRGQRHHGRDPQRVGVCVCVCGGGVGVCVVCVCGGVGCVCGGGVCVCGGVGVGGGVEIFSVFEKNPIFYKDTHTTLSFM